MQMTDSDFTLKTDGGGLAAAAPFSISYEWLTYLLSCTVSSYGWLFVKFSLATERELTHFIALS